MLAANVSGLATAADPQPLDVNAYRAALIAGCATFDVITQAGRPWKLRQRIASVPTSGLAIVAAHDCGAGGRDATTVTEVPAGPPSARVSAIGRPVPPSAFSQPQTGYDRRNHASAATHPSSDPSDWAHRCQICRQLIEPGEPYWAIDHATVHWAQHDDCP
ncbi:hypothetical protein SAMN05442782_2377 [Streptomyces sp. OK228]|nr:hypothetical protein SAMN05442782_2377 [Streptomyces sp. OK228]